MGKVKNISFLVFLILGISCSVKKTVATEGSGQSLSFEVTMLRALKNKQVGGYKLKDTKNMFYGVSLNITNTAQSRKSFFLYKAELSGESTKAVPALFYQGNGINFADEWADIARGKSEKRYLVYVFPRDEKPEKLLIEGFGEVSLPEIND